MTAVRTARERARAELTEEIKNAARRNVAESGAPALSLRAVARELGLVSSALYRYFPSRDDLLTALILDAYVGLAETLEAAAAGVSDKEPIERWRAVCHAARDWARERPHEYSLVYGSPVPGYRAPQATIEPAARVLLSFVGVARDAAAAGRLVVADPAPPMPELLTDQLRAVAADVAPQLAAATVAALFQAVAQLLGTVSSELYGHWVGSVDPTDDFFAYSVDRLAALVGLPAG